MDFQVAGHVVLEGLLRAVFEDFFDDAAHRVAFKAGDRARRVGVLDRPAGKVVSVPAHTAPVVGGFDDAAGRVAFEAVGPALGVGNADQPGFGVVAIGGHRTVGIGVGGHPAGAGVGQAGAATDVIAVKAQA